MPPTSAVRRSPRVKRRISRTASSCCRRRSGGRCARCTRWPPDRRHRRRRPPARKRRAGPVRKDIGTPPGQRPAGAIDDAQQTSSVALADANAGTRLRRRFDLFDPRLRDGRQRRPLRDLDDLCVCRGCRFRRKLSCQTWHSLPSRRTEGRGARALSRSQPLRDVARTRMGRCNALEGLVVWVRAHLSGTPDAVAASSTINSARRAVVPTDVTSTLVDPPGNAGRDGYLPPPPAPDRARPGRRPSGPPVVVDEREAVGGRSQPGGDEGLTMATPHVVVVGGGLAGIPAALDAADAGATVTLIERRSHLGGLTWSFRHNGLRFDNGQHIFMRCCVAYQGFLDESTGHRFYTPAQTRCSVLAPDLRSREHPPLRTSRAAAPRPVARALRTSLRARAPEVGSSGRGPATRRPRSAFLRRRHVRPVAPRSRAGHRGHREPLGPHHAPDAERAG